jgi:hypothetical protein
MYLCTPTVGADEVSREKWQLVNDIHDECDGLILWTDTDGYHSTHSCCICLGLARTNTMVSFRVFWWSFSAI